MTLTALPTELATLVETYAAQAGMDFTDADAMRGMCEDYSIDLARAP